MNYKNKIKKRNPVVRDLHSSKYRMRVVQSDKFYSRKKEKQEMREQFNE
jgi:hypothetical protein